MKQAIEQLIVKLAGDYNECSEKLCVHVCPKLNTTIGDVLDYMQNVSCEWMDDAQIEPEYTRLCMFWEKCDFRKSLQKIYAETEWENGIPKQESYMKFWSFLLSLNL